MDAHDPGQSRPRVLLADDHAGVLTVLLRLLSSSCEVVGSVVDGIALLEAAERLKPDVVVADVFMPRMNGLDACEQIKQTMPQTRIVLLTASDDGAIEGKAFSLGASAFVRKDLLWEQLLNAVHNGARSQRRTAHP